MPLAIATAPRFAMTRPTGHIADPCPIYRSNHLEWQGNSHVRTSGNGSTLALRIPCFVKVFPVFADMSREAR